MAIMLPIVVTAVVAGSGPKMPPELAQLIVQPFMHHARLHAHLLVVEADHAAQMGRKIEDQSRPERFARHAGAGAAGMKRHMIFGRILQQAATSAVERGRTTPSGLIS